MPSLSLSTEERESRERERMGKIVEKKKKRKKKGRPSLLDLQKRSLEDQSHAEEPPNSSSNCAVDKPRRSTRRNPVPEEEESSPERVPREKKLNLVLKLPNSSSGEEGGRESEAEEDGDGDAAQNQRKRKIAAIGDGSGGSEKGEKLAKTGNGLQGAAETQLDSGASTPLPDRKLLLYILDRLQKKDTYGVFSEPVDPEELPDYHDVIDNPMDFGTVRKKLDKGGYAKLEEFESDVFLICSNAMQYNAPDTVYFRQARSIQELARKNFGDLRHVNDDNQPEPKIVRRGRPPTKHLKRPPGRPPLDRGGSSDATLAPGGEKAKPANFDLIKGSLSAEKPGQINSSGRLRNNDVYAAWLLENRFERNDDNTGSPSKASLMKFGKKQTEPDECRRNTYRQSHPSTSGRETTVLATFNRERKQLLSVGLQADHGYARSLARFAANLGPIVWKVASKRIEKSLPSGLKFGPGWVGVDDFVPSRVFQPASPPSLLWPFSACGSLGSNDTDRAAGFQQDDSADNPEEERSNSLEGHHQPSAPSSEPLLASGNNPQVITEDSKYAEGSKSKGPFQGCRNGFVGPFGHNNNLAAAHKGKMTEARPSSRLHFGFPSSAEAPEPRKDVEGPTDRIERQDPDTLHNKSAPGRSTLSPKPQQQQKPELVPPDLNIRFHSPSDSAQPDLVLQL